MHLTKEKKHDSKNKFIFLETCDKAFSQRDITLGVVPEEE